MKIQAINSQNFEAKKLRLTVKKMDLTNPDLINYGIQTKNVNLVKEYWNPNAKALYDQAMKTNNIKEKSRLLTEMGEYELYNFGDGALGKLRMNLYLVIAKITDLFS